MPKIVLSSDQTTWVGFELYPGERYTSFDDVCFNVSLDDIVVEPTIEQIFEDIEIYLKIKLASDTPPSLVLDIVQYLCQPRYVGETCRYFSNRSSKFKISKYNGTEISTTNS